MSEAVYREEYYSPKVGYVTYLYRNSPELNSTTSSVDAAKYLYHSKGASVSGAKFIGTNFRRPMPWSMSWVNTDRLFSGRVSYYHVEGAVDVIYDGGLPISHSAPNSPFPASLAARAELDALLKLKDEKVNVGVSLGERKQVAGMFKDNLLRVANAYRSARKGNFKKAARQLGLTWRDVPNKWLELQYGWKPLLSDIHTAVEALNEKDREDPSRTWLHVKGKAKSLEVSDYAEGTSFNGVAAVSNDKHHFEAKVRFDFTPKEEMGLQRTLDQWGISNPLQIAWELIPFSFVFDWAVPIGDYLAAMGASEPYDFIAGSQSRFTKSTRGSYLKSSSDISASGTARGERVQFDRYIYYYWPHPDARALLASSNPSQQTIATRVANALSILSNAVK